MAHSLFISDLHLGPGNPRVTRLFQHFMQHVAPGAEALYILGDLFEYWAGDDDLDAPCNRQAVQSLRRLAESGVRLCIMHGNRDFLMAEKLVNACRASLLDDPALVDLYGVPTLLTHGDTLCTDDTAYQSYRREVREPAWRAQFLAQPLEQRKSAIEQLRLHSENEKRRKSCALMDASDAAVADMLRKYGYPRLIHGHTHRLMRARHTVDNHECERWVLGEWGESGNALRCDSRGCAWETIACAA
jgi:UDP-2,3-diacylglucosamine hydrolase